MMVTETANQTNPVQWYPGMCILNIKTCTNLVSCVLLEKLLNKAAVTQGTTAKSNIGEHGPVHCPAQSPRLRKPGCVAPEWSAEQSYEDPAAGSYPLLSAGTEELMAGKRFKDIKVL